MSRRIARAIGAMTCVMVSMPLFVMESGCGGSGGDPTQDESEAAGTARRVTVTGKPGYRSIDYQFASGGELGLYHGTMTLAPAAAAISRMSVTIGTQDLVVTQTGPNAWRATVRNTERFYSLTSAPLGTRTRFTVVAYDESRLSIVVQGFGSAASSALLVATLADDVVDVPSADECIGDPPTYIEPFDQTFQFEAELLAAGCDAKFHASVQLHHKPGFEWNVVRCPVSPAVNSIVWKWQATDPVYSMLDCVGGIGGHVHVLYDPRCTGCTTAYVPQ